MEHNHDIIEPKPNTVNLVTPALEEIRKGMQAAFNAKANRMTPARAKAVLDGVLKNEEDNQIELSYVGALSLVSAWLKTFLVPRVVYEGNWTLPAGRFVPTAGNTFYTTCHLKIVNRDDKTVVFITELATNAGASVTNCMQELIPAIVACFKLDPDRTAFVEIYDDRSYNSWHQPHKDWGDKVDTFDRVVVTYNHVDKRYIAFDWEHIPANERHLYEEVSNDIFA